MKYIYSLLLSLILLSPAYAGSNTNDSVLENTNVVSSITNLNDIVIDILHGAKGVGKEIYSTSKIAIAKSVDFTMQQTPLVVKEFLAWKVAEAIIYILTGLIISIVIWVVSCKLISYGKKDEDTGAVGAGNFFKVMSCLICIIACCTQGMIITEILVAPRVFLIEYIVNIIK